MSTTTELQRIKRVMDREVIEPVSRVMLPSDMRDSPLFDGARFFVVVSQRHMDDPRHMNPATCMIFAEGTAGFRQWCGRRAQG
jgi:hypothetical protein